MSISSLAVLFFWACWASIAGTYILFPLMLAAFAKHRGVRTESHAEDLTTENLPDITMVVAAFNEGSVLQAKLENTWKIDYPADKLHIVIGSDGSADATSEILSSCQDSRLISYLFKERRGKISVLNDLMVQVKTEIVVMSDANTMFAKDSLRKLVRHFQNPNVGCVSGELSLEQKGGVSGEGLYWKYESWIKRNEGRLGFLIGCNGGIFAIRKALYERLPASTIVEDFVLTLRILEKGFQVRFEPEAKATEPACTSARAEMIRKIRIGAGGWQAVRLTASLLHPRYGMRAFAFWGHKVLRWLVPVFCLVALAANVALLSSSVYQAPFGLQLLGAAVAIWAYRATERRPLPGLLRPIGYFYLMNYALGCGLIRYIFGTQKVTWDRAAQIG